MISILILTYKQPVALELCLESIVKNQHYKNQILIVENGFCEENKPIFEKYKEHIEVLPFEENVGMNRALNLGVCNIKYELVFIGHDDMVYPKNFDLKLKLAFWDSTHGHSSINEYDLIAPPAPTSES